MRSKCILGWDTSIGLRGLVTQILIPSLIIGLNTSVAQQLSNEHGLSPKELFKSRNYVTALPEYLKMVEKDPENMDFKYKLAQCYLYIDDDKSRVIPLLEEVCSKEKYKLEALFDLGRAYHLNLEFDKAIKAYTDYKSQSNDAAAEKTDRQIEMCYNGKELIKYPLNVTFENLGKYVNSPYPDFSPFTPEDEAILIFTSRRKGNKGGLMDYDGFYTSDIYLANVKAGNFKRAQNISVINTELDEEAAGISPKGDKILVFVDDIYQNIYGNIYISEKRGKSFQKLTSIGENVNDNSSIETSASITSDDKILYFASDKKGGFGGTDIYMSKKLPDGSWGKAVNLGPKINTKYNEDYPSISSDGMTMYLSSEGFTSMGGFDLFKSTFDEENQSWSTPTNIGYPVNTPDDNMNISFSAAWDSDQEKASSRYAYIAAYRKEGFGNLDIYRVTFNKVEPKLTAITGTVTTKILIESSTYKTFHVYRKGEVELTIPDECHPWFDKNWKFAETKKVKVKPGYTYKTAIYFDSNGKQKVFSSKKYPKNNSLYEFKQVKNSLVKIPNYVAPEKKYKFQPITDAMLIVTDKNNMNEYTYTPSRSGRYVIILPPGSYNIFVDVPGFKPVSEDFELLGKSSFRAEITKDYVFSPDE